MLRRKYAQQNDKPKKCSGGGCLFLLVKPLVMFLLCKLFGLDEAKRTKKIKKGNEGLKIEELEGTTIPVFNLNVIVTNLLQKFIISGRFGLESSDKT